MAQLNWGHATAIGLDFRNDDEYYECLGYISNQNHKLSVYTHKNDESGAWAGQGKLHNHRSIGVLPSSLQRSFKQSGDQRLSVTDYVSNLVYNHAFCLFYDPTGNRYTYYRSPESSYTVLSTIPKDQQGNFMRGYNML